VGQVIALLAEEGDDLSAIEVPSDLSPPGAAAPPPKAAEADSKPAEKKADEPKKAEPAASKPSPSPEGSGEKNEHGHKIIKHSRPLFPSVSRL
jgi:pyruvate/2-oxoglutarate dehydrogenase complex dihydrolipoamide acyltransferase (E2) component